MSLRPIVQAAAVSAWLICITVDSAPTAAQLPNAEQPDASDSVGLSEQKFEAMVQSLRRDPKEGAILERVLDHLIEKGRLESFLNSLQRESQASDHDGITLGRLHLLHALMLHALGKDEEAFSHFAEAASELKTDAAVHVHYARVLRAAGRYEDALAALETAIEQRPPRTLLLSITKQLAAVPVGTVDEMRLKETWSVVRERFSTDTTALRQVAEIAMDGGVNAEGIEILRDVVNRSRTRPDKIETQITLAKALNRDHQHVEARDLLFQAIGQALPGSHPYETGWRTIDDSFADQRDFSGLLAAYATWHVQHPEDIASQLRLARWLIRLRRFDEAISLCEQSIISQPNSVAWHGLIIEAASAGEDIQRALRSVQELVRIEPQRLEHRLLWGELAARDKRQSDQALASEVKRILKSAAELPDLKTIVLLKIGDAFLRHDFRGEAEATYRRACDGAPDNPLPSEVLARMLMRQERRDEALAVVSRFAARSDEREHLLSVASLLRRIGAPEEELKMLRRVCEARPRVADRLRFIDCLVDAEQYDDAIDELHQAALHLTDDSERRNWIRASVAVYESAGRLSDRATECAAQLERRADDRFLRLESAKILSAMGKSAEALKAIEAGLQQTPDWVEYLLVAADLCEHSGELTEALRYRSRLAEVDRRFRSVHLLAEMQLCRRSGDLAQAAKIGERIVQDPACSAESMCAVADLYVEQRNTEQAVQLLRRCVQKYKNDPTAYLQLAVLHGQARRNVEALDILQQGAGQVQDRSILPSWVATIADSLKRTDRTDELIDWPSKFTAVELPALERLKLIVEAAIQIDDIRLAQDELEKNLSERPDDAELMQLSIELAEHRNDPVEAIRLRKRLAEIDPSPEKFGKLGLTLLKKSQTLEAIAPLKEAAKSREGRGLCLQAAYELTKQLEWKTAASVLENASECDELDWEVLHALMAVYELMQEWERAEQAADKLLSLRLPADTPPRSLPIQGTSRGVTGFSSLQAVPLEVMRREVKWSESFPLVTYLSTARYLDTQAVIDYSHACFHARFVRDLIDHHRGRVEHDRLQAALKRVLSPDAKREDAVRWMEWDAFEKGREHVSNTNEPRFIAGLFRARELDPELGTYPLANALMKRYFLQFKWDRGSRPPLAAEDLDRLAALAIDRPQDKWVSSGGLLFGWQELAISEFFMGGRFEDVRRLMDELIRQLRRDADLPMLAELLIPFGEHVDPELMKLSLRDMYAASLSTHQSAPHSIDASARFVELLARARKRGDNIFGTEEETKAAVAQALSAAISRQADRVVVTRPITLDELWSNKSIPNGLVSGKQDGRLVPYVWLLRFTDSSSLEDISSVLRDFSIGRQTFLDSLEITESEQSPRVASARCIVRALLFAEAGDSREIDELNRARSFCGNGMQVESDAIQLVKIEQLISSNRTDEARRELHQWAPLVGSHRLIKDAIVVLLSGNGEYAQDVEQSVGSLSRAKLTQERASGIQLLLSAKGFPSAAKQLTDRNARASSREQTIVNRMDAAWAAGKQSEAVVEARSLLSLLSRSSIEAMRNSSGSRRLRHRAFQVLSETNSIREWVDRRLEEFRRFPNDPRLVAEQLDLAQFLEDSEKIAALVVPPEDPLPVQGLEGLTVQLREAAELRNDTSEGVDRWAKLFCTALKEYPHSAANLRNHAQLDILSGTDLPEEVSRTVWETAIEIGFDKLHCYDASIELSLPDEDEELSQRIVESLIEDCPNDGKSVLQFAKWWSEHFDKGLNTEHQIAFLRKLLHVAGSASDQSILFLSWGGGEPFGMDVPDTTACSADLVLKIVDEDAEVARAMDQLLQNEKPTPVIRMMRAILAGRAGKSDSAHAAILEAFAEIDDEMIFNEAIWSLVSLLEHEPELQETALEVAYRALQNPLRTPLSNLTVIERLLPLLGKYGKSEALRTVTKLQAFQDTGYTPFQYGRSRLGLAIAESLKTAGLLREAMAELNSAHFANLTRYEISDELKLSKQKLIEEILQVDPSLVIESLVDARSDRDQAITWALSFSYETSGDKKRPVVNSLLEDALDAARKNAASVELSRIRQKLVDRATANPDDASSAAVTAWLQLRDGNSRELLSLLKSGRYSASLAPDASDMQYLGAFLIDRYLRDLFNNRESAIDPSEVSAVIETVCKRAPGETQVALFVRAAELAEAAGRQDLSGWFTEQSLKCDGISEMLLHEKIHEAIADRSESLLIQALKALPRASLEKYGGDRFQRLSRGIQTRLELIFRSGRKGDAILSASADTSDVDLALLASAIDQIREAGLGTPSVTSAYLNVACSNIDSFGALAGRTDWTCPTFFERMIESAGKQLGEDTVLKRLSGEDPNHKAALWIALSVFNRIDDPAWKPQRLTSQELAQLPTGAAAAVIAAMSYDESIPTSELVLLEQFIDESLQSVGEDVVTFAAAIAQTARRRIEQTSSIDEDVEVSAAIRRVEVFCNKVAELESAEVADSHQWVLHNELAKSLIARGGYRECLSVLEMKNLGSDTLGQHFYRRQIGILLEKMHQSSETDAMYATLRDWTFDGGGRLHHISTTVNGRHYPLWFEAQGKTEAVALPFSSFQHLPTVSTFLLLAEYAERAGTQDDLMKRIDEALASNRAGAQVLDGLARSVFNRPQRQASLQWISSALKSMPEDAVPSAIFPHLSETIQLAFRLASDPAHENWARATLRSLHSLAEIEADGDILPTLARDCFHRNNYSSLEFLKREKDDAISSQPTDKPGLRINNSSTAGFALWEPSSDAGAWELTHVHEQIEWFVDDRGDIFHAYGPGQDTLWFQRPLVGPFQIDVDLYDGPSNATELWIYGIRIPSVHDLSYQNLFADSGPEIFDMRDQLLKWTDWNHRQIRYDGKKLSLFVNDRLVFKEEVETRSPWFGLTAANCSLAGFRNLRIQTSSEVPNTLPLISDHNLVGWSSRFYQDKLPIQAVASNKDRLTEWIEASGWDVAEGVLFSKFTGDEWRSRAMFYQRPLCDGETIEYEYYAEADRFDVAPIIGRTAYFISNQGVSRRWLMDRDSHYVEQNNERLIESSKEAALRMNDWNRVQVTRRGNAVVINVNDLQVAEVEIDQQPSGARFGFYQDRDKFACRIRNVQLRNIRSSPISENLFEPKTPAP